MDNFEKVGTYVGFIEVVLLLVEVDDESDNVDGATWTFFQFTVGYLPTVKDGLHVDPKALVDPLGILSQGHEEGIDVGMLAFPMLGEGD